MWTYFNIITYLTIALWLLAGGLIYSKSKALRSLAVISHLVARRLYYSLVEELGTPSLAYLGGDTYMVRLFYGAHRLCNLPAL